MVNQYLQARIVMRQIFMKRNCKQIIKYANICKIKFIAFVQKLIKIYKTNLE